MDLTMRLIDADYAEKRRLLELAKGLTDAQLDAPFAFRHDLPWEARTLRQLLGGLTGHGWVSEMMKTAGWSLNGAPYEMPAPAHTVDELIGRLDAFTPHWRGFVDKVNREGLLDDTWVDASCTSPETFTYELVIKDNITNSIVLRGFAHKQLEQAGVPVGDPRN